MGFFPDSREREIERESFCNDTLFHQVSSGFPEVFLLRRDVAFPALGRELVNCCVVPCSFFYLLSLDSFVYHSNRLRNSTSTTRFRFKTLQSGIRAKVVAGNRTAKSNRTAELNQRCLEFRLQCLTDPVISRYGKQESEHISALSD